MGVDVFVEFFFVGESKPDRFTYSPEPGLEPRAGDSSLAKSAIRRMCGEMGNVAMNVGNHLTIVENLFTEVVEATFRADTVVFSLFRE